jgi:hypothetical protein
MARRVRGPKAYILEANPRASRIDAAAAAIVVMHERGGADRAFARHAVT